MMVVSKFPIPKVRNEVMEKIDDLKLRPPNLEEKTLISLAPLLHAWHPGNMAFLCEL